MSSLGQKLTHSPLHPISPIISYQDSAADVSAVQSTILQPPPGVMHVIIHHTILLLQTL